MPRLSASKAAVLVALAACAAGAPAAQLRFDDAFTARHATSIHYQARFTGPNGRQQKLEAWRDGDSRVKRRTNDAIETYAIRKGTDAEYSMTVLDLQRKLLTRIDRTNLFRIGNFTEWFDLAHGLRHPRGEYKLAMGHEPAGAERTIAKCRWFDLEQNGRTSHICWSAQAQLPLAIVDGQGATVWNVTKLEAARIPPATFDIDSRGFVVNDANEDIQRD